MAWTPDESAAAARIPLYDNDNYPSDPNGMGNGGHKVNFFQAIQDVLTLANATVREAASAVANWRGDWSNVTNYAVGDGVLYDGSSWRALLAGVNHAPPTLPTTSNSYWKLVARRGADGSGDAGNDGWSPVIAMESDGARRVARVIDWSGGEGTKPGTGYIGADGLKANIADGVDVRGTPGRIGAMTWNFSIVTTSSAPGVGLVAFNNADPTLVTQLRFNVTNGEGVDVTAWLDSLDNSPGTSRGRIDMIATDGTLVYSFIVKNDNGTAAAHRVISVEWNGGSASVPAAGKSLGVAFSSAGTQGIQGVPGPDGWTPVFGLEADGARRVQKVVDWVGGTGTKPDVNVYVTSTGYSTTIGDGVDVRGPSGAGSGDVTTSGSVTSGHFARFADGSGDVLEDGGEIGDLASKDKAGVVDLDFTGTPAADTFAAGDGSWKPVSLSNVPTGFVAAAGGFDFDTGYTGFTSAEETKLAGISSGADVTNAVTVAAAVNSTSSKAAPIDNDRIGITDSAASYSQKYLTWANLKATLKTHFDSLYAPISALVSIATASEIRTGSDTAKAVGVSTLWGAGALVSLTDAATVAVDLSSGVNFSLTPTASRTVGNPTSSGGWKAGQSGVIVVTRSGTQTLTFSSNWKKYGSGALSATSGKGALIPYLVVSSTVIVYAIIPEV